MDLFAMLGRLRERYVLGFVGNLVVEIGESMEGVHGPVDDVEEIGDHGGVLRGGGVDEVGGVAEAGELGAVLEIGVGGGPFLRVKVQLCRYYRA
jgi:hypothetical protein